jgi:WD40 repeat protein
MNFAGLGTVFAGVVIEDQAVPRPSWLMKRERQQVTDNGPGRWMQRRMAPAFLLIVIGLSISGCVYVPPIGEDEAIDPVNFVVGVTTRSEAVKLLDDPLVDRGRFVFDELYSSSGGIYIPAGQGGYLPIDGQHKRILLEFDEDDILIKKNVVLGTAVPSPILGVTPRSVADLGLSPMGEALTFGESSWFGVTPDFHAAAFSPDGAILAASDSSDEIYLIDVGERSIRSISPEGFDSDGYVFSIAFSPDGRLLAVLSRSIRIIDMRTLEQTVAFAGHGNAYFWETKGARAMAFGPSGKVIASGGTDGDVKVWDATSGRQLASWSASDEWIYGIAFSPDGRLLATASGDGLVRLWDVESRTQLAALEIRGRPVISGDGTKLAIVNPAYVELRRLEPTAAATSKDPEAVISEPLDMILLPYFSYRAHEAIFPTSSVFAADGTALLVSIGPTMIWQTSAQRKSQVSIPEAERFLAFGPRGRMLATFGQDGVRFWKVPESAIE